MVRSRRIRVSDEVYALLVDCRAMLELEDHRLYLFDPVLHDALQKYMSYIRAGEKRA